MLAARLRALRRAGAPAEALSASLRPSTARAAFSTAHIFRKPAAEEDVDDKLPIGYGTRLPLAIQAVYAEPLRRQATHNLPVCDLQLRSYSVRNLEFMCDFAMRAAYYCNLPAFGPVPLPKKTERWTVPRSNFVHKKSQENFERITHKRLIQIKDGNPETVELWLAFLRKHQFHGVGFKANVFNWEPLGGSQTKLGSLRDPTKKNTQRKFGPEMSPYVHEEVERILGTKEYQKLMEEYAEQPPTSDPAAEAASQEEIIKDAREEEVEEGTEAEKPVSADVLEAEISARSDATVESPAHQEARAELGLSHHHEHLDTIASEIRNTRVEIAESRASHIDRQVQNARGHVVSARVEHLEQQLKNVKGHVVSARVENIERQLKNARGHIVSARAERLAEEISNAFEHVSAARAAREALNVRSEEPLVDAQKQEQEEISQAQPEELIAIAREAVEAASPKATEPENKAAEEKPAEKTVEEKTEEWKPGQAWPTVKKDS